MVRFLSAFLVVLVLVFSRTAHANVALSVTPATMSFDARPSQRAVQRVRFGNKGTDSVRLLLSPREVMVTDSGEKKFLEPGQVSNGCATWFEPFPLSFAIEPGSGVNVDFAAKIPASAREGSWTCAIIAAQDMGAKVSAGDFGTLLKKNVQRTAIGVVPSVGVVFVINVLGETGKFATAIDIIDATVRHATKSTPLLVRVRVKNDGAYLARPGGALGIFDGAGAAITSVAIKPTPIHPQRSAWLEVDVPLELKPGRYTLVASLGDDHGASSVVDFEYEPPPPMPAVPPPPPKDPKAPAGGSPQVTKPAGPAAGAAPAKAPAPTNAR